MRPDAKKYAIYTKAIIRHFFKVFATKLVAQFFVISFIFTKHTYTKSVVKLISSLNHYYSHICTVSFFPPLLLHNFAWGRLSFEATMPHFNNSEMLPEFS